jgi:hypothetical protein
MKTARFASIVAHAGKPDVHLTLVNLAKDAPLQRALKAHRVMTIHQSRGSTDYGTIGYEKTPTSQILIFPKSLRKYAEAKIIGVKYDLFDESNTLPPKPPPARKSPKPTKPKPPPVPEDSEPDENLAALHAGIRRALRLLEQGKQVAAYDCLERLVS